MKKTSKLIFGLLVIVAGGIIFMGLRLSGPGANNSALVAYAILLIFVIVLFLFKIRKSAEGIHAENSRRDKRKLPITIFGVIAGIILWLACWHYLGQPTGRPH
jgi:Ca2+/Na+ antiporter